MRVTGSRIGLIRVSGAFRYELLLKDTLNPTHRPLSNSILWSIFRVLEGNPKKDLLMGLSLNSRPCRGSIESLGVRLCSFKPMGVGGLRALGVQEEPPSAEVAKKLEPRPRV